LAAQDAEDKRSDHQRRHPDVRDRPGRHRRGDGDYTATVTGRDGKTYTYWTPYIADVIGKEMGQLPVADRRQIVGLLAGEGMSNRAIADAVGVNEITVRCDKEQVRPDVALNRSTPITGRPLRRSWPRRIAGPTPPRSPAATTRPTFQGIRRGVATPGPNAVPSRCARR